jgi:hypothetical protein
VLLPRIDRNENQDQQQHADPDKNGHEQLLSPGITKPGPEAGFHVQTLVAGDGFEPPTFGL